MSDSRKDKKDFEESFGEELGDESVDEELLAMAPPPPNLRLAVFTLSVFVLSIVMVVWFFPEFRYLLSGIGGPKPLGDAAGLEVSSMEADTYVSVEGLPRVTTTLEYSEGIRWFPGEDNVCKFFPLVGQPNLFVQWPVPPEHKVYRDEGRNPTEPSPPSFFQGRLVPRSELKKKNFKRIWVYFDCLKLHSGSRCRYCLGRNSLDECRRAFTCMEAHGGEECGLLLERSIPNLEEEIQAVQEQISQGVSLTANKQKLQNLKKLRMQVAEQQTAVRAVRLEEVGTRLAGIERRLSALSPDEVSRFRKLAARVVELELQVLKIFARPFAQFIEKMTEDQRRQLEAHVSELEAAVVAEEEHIAQMRLLTEYVDVDHELRMLRRRIGQIKKKMPSLDEARLASLKDWNLDPEKAEGAQILSQMALLTETCFKSMPTGAADAGTDASVGSGEAAAPDIARISALLDRLAKRALALETKLAVVKPGQLPDFDKWVRKPDVLGVVPKGLKGERVIGSFDILEKMLSSVPEPSGSLQTVAAVKNEAIDLLHEKRKRIAELQAVPGVGELQTLSPLWDLEKEVDSQRESVKLAELEVAFLKVRRGLMEKGLVPAELGRIPEAMADLEKVLVEADLDSLVQQTDQLWKKTAKEDWVLFDGEVPLDRIWVLLIYLVLAVMVFVNVRRLLIFWKAWRSS